MTSLLIFIAILLEDFKYVVFEIIMSNSLVGPRLQ